MSLEDEDELELAVLLGLVVADVGSPDGVVVPVEDPVAEVELPDEPESALLAVAVATAPPQVMTPAATATRNLLRVVCCIVFPQYFGEASLGGTLGKTTEHPIGCAAAADLGRSRNASTTE
ncbi:hypothetical protein [Flexivirga sp. B27]